MEKFKFTLKETILPTLKLLLLVSSVGIGWYFLRNTPLGESLRDYEWVRLKIAHEGFLGPLLFVVFGGISTVFGFPRLALCGISGFVFGFNLGALWGLSGTLFGCILTFYYAKLMGRSFIDKKLPEKLKRFEPLLRQHSFSITLMIRFIPVGNNTLTNLLAGVSSVKAIPYFFASAIGYLPLTLIFALIGSGVRKDIWLRASLSVVLLVISILIMVYLMRKIMAKTSLDNALELK